MNLSHILLNYYVPVPELRELCRLYTVVVVVNKVHHLKIAIKENEKIYLHALTINVKKILHFLNIIITIFICIVSGKNKHVR